MIAASRLRRIRLEVSLQKLRISAYDSDRCPQLMRSVSDENPLGLHRGLYRAQRPAREEVSARNGWHNARGEHRQKDDSQLGQRCLFGLDAAPNLHQRSAAAGHGHRKDIDALGLALR